MKAWGMFERDARWASRQEEMRTRRHEVAMRQMRIMKARMMRGELAVAVHAVRMGQATPQRDEEMDAMQNF